MYQSFEAGVYSVDHGTATEAMLVIALGARVKILSINYVGVQCHEANGATSF